MNPEVDHYLSEGCGRCSLVSTPQCKVHRWQQELQLLRIIILECGLTEQRKWSMPCYTHNTKNVLVMAAFKEYCCVSFFKGSLLTDEAGILVAPGENSQSTRQLRFTSVDAIQKSVHLIKAYIFEAVELEKSGKKVAFKKIEEFEPPAEFQQRMDEMPLLAEAFRTLTPGRQRAWMLWFTQPKQQKTREARIEKAIPLILSGKGPND